MKSTVNVNKQMDKWRNHYEEQRINRSGFFEGW